MSDEGELMDAYLARFRSRLKPREGSLVRVASVSEPNAKEYLSQLAKAGAVDRVDWGWYYVPAQRPPESALEFLAQDKNFKVVTGQTAASFWNGDFIHRDAVTVTVDDASYKRALGSFAEKKAWSIDAEYDSGARGIPARNVGRLRVEERGATVADCFKRWAFIDAVATLTPRLPARVKREAYWERISGTNVRVGQAVQYAAHRLFDGEGDARINDDFVRKQLDEAVEKVRELA